MAIGGQRRKADEVGELGAHRQERASRGYDRLIVSYRSHAAKTQPGRAGTRESDCAAPGQNPAPVHDRDPRRAGVND